MAMNSKTLLRGGCVLTFGAKTPNFMEADVLIDQGRIAEVGPGLRARDAELVDAKDTIVMPGFVDTHRHAWKSLFRNMGESGSGGMDAESHNGVSAVDYGPHHQPEDVYAATLIGLLGAIEAGITTVVDWSDIQLDDRSVDAALQAHVDAGLRTVFVHSVPEWAGGQSVGSAVRRLATGRTDPVKSTTTIAFGSSEPVRSNFDRACRRLALGAGPGAAHPCPCRFRQGGTRGGLPAWLSGECSLRTSPLSIAPTSMTRISMRSSPRGLRLPWRRRARWVGASGRFRSKN